jgi:hypothetical protein
VTLAGRQIAHPSPEDLVVLLCLHGAKHEWRRIGWICDIAELIRSSPNIAWDQIIAQADEAGASRMVRLGLLLSANVLGAALPVSIDRWARADTAAVSLASRIQQHHYVDSGGYPEAFSRTRFHIAARERWRDKFRRASGQALTPSWADWTVLPLPPRLAFLYSFVRFVRLLVKHGAQALIRASTLRLP